VPRTNVEGSKDVTGNDIGGRVAADPWLQAAGRQSETP
jgi:hypothetical protein